METTTQPNTEAILAQLLLARNLANDAMAATAKAATEYTRLHQMIAKLDTRRRDEVAARNNTEEFIDAAENEGANLYFYARQIGQAIEVVDAAKASAINELVHA